MPADIVDGNGDLREVVDHQIVDESGTLRDVVRRDIIDANGTLRTVWEPDGTVDESAYLNLASEVPQRAWDVWEAKPDFYADPDYDLWDASAYDGRNGDIAELIKEASQAGALVDLGSGTYEIESQVNDGNTGSEIVGVVGNGARIYHVGVGLEGNSDDVLFHGISVDEVVFEGVTFDITEDPPGGGISDVSILTTWGGIQEFWAEDMTLEGSRCRNQDLDGDGVRDYNGWGSTFLVQVDDGGQGFVHRCEFPDGGTDRSEMIGTHSDHAIGPNSDGDNDGLLVWKDCYCANFYGNGFYIMGSGSTGESILWDCHAENNAKGNFRIGPYDKIIGGVSEVNSMRPRNGRHKGSKLIDAQFGTDMQVIGLTMRATAPAFGGNAIQLRTDFEDVLFEKCVLDIQEGDRFPIRMNSSNGAGECTLRDVYFHDSYGSADYMVRISPDTSSGRLEGPSTLIIENTDDARVYMDGGTEFIVGSNGTLDVEGTTYSGTTVTAEDLDLEHPRDPYGGDLPEFYFAYESTPED